MREVHVPGRPSEFRRPERAAQRASDAVPIDIADSWVEVDLDDLAHNVRQVKLAIGPEVVLLAVVKADAYGHGMVPVARTALANGAARLGVSSVGEGRILRLSGINAPILVMGQILPHQIAAALRHRLTLAVGTPELATALSAAAVSAGKRVFVHLKIDTGLGRLGVRPDRALALARTIVSLPNLKLEGVYSHLASAFRRDQRFARHQLNTFLQVVEELETAGIHVALRHIANSEAAITMPQTRLDMVRVGNLLYGECPLPGGCPQLDLRPAWTWKTRVVHVGTFEPGQSIGYGQDYVARRPGRYAVLPVGLAEGFGLDVPRRPWTVRDLGKGIARECLAYLGRREGNQVRIQGRPVPVLGRVGMQTTTVDVTELPEVRPGDIAVLTARKVIVSSRVPRVYRGSGRRANEDED